MLRATAALAAGCLAFLVAVAAHAAEPAFPRLTGRVVDEAGVLDPLAEQRLSEQLEAHERATGNQVVVATLRSLQGLTVEEFANRLYRDWGLGRAEEEDGALLVVAPGERRVRIEVGYGLEGVLTDAAASTIVQSLVLPRFRAGDLPGGIEAGARGILELLRPEDGAASSPPAWSRPSTRQAPIDSLSWLPILLAVVVLLMMVGTFRRAAGGGASRMPGYPGGYYRRGGYGMPPVIVIPGGFGRSGGGGFGGGFGGGGGGFSGGGGSSGGGGASGSW